MLLVRISLDLLRRARCSPRMNFCQWLERISTSGRKKARWDAGRLDRRCVRGRFQIWPPRPESMDRPEIMPPRPTGSGRSSKQVGFEGREARAGVSSGVVGDDESVAKMGHPNLLWVRSGPPRATPSCSTRVLVLCVGYSPEDACPEGERAEAKKCNS